MSHRIRRAQGGAALRTLAPLTAALALALAACASDAPPAESAPASSETPHVSAPPPGSALAKVEVGMDDEEVRGILGPPSGRGSYSTFKAWMPFYQGGDEWRYVWRYTGTGRITFNNNRYSGELQVIRVEYDPGEDGV